MTIEQMAHGHFEALQQIGTPAPGNCAAVPADCEDLPPLLKALLVADGTVTVQLAAAYAEPVGITPIAQGKVHCALCLPRIQVASGDEVFFRAIRLEGRHSGRVFADANSVLNPDRIDPVLFEQLIQERAGMGEILRNAAKGSYREVIHIERQDPGTAVRTYVVFLDGQPAILITEKFVVEAFTDP